jgi:hypothetical protein
LQLFLWVFLTETPKQIDISFGMNKYIIYDIQRVAAKQVPNQAAK